MGKELQGGALEMRLYRSSAEGAIVSMQELKLGRVQWGSWTWKPFCPPFLVRRGQTPASMLFPEFQRDSHSC